MAGPTNTHTLQDRYSPLVDAKLRNTLVTKDNLIFNNRYEGNPKAGKVKIPVRDTEVEVSKYDRANGLSPKAGGTTYLDLDIDNDVAVNELIDGYEASAVPDGIVAERLDSAGYALAEVIDITSIETLEAAENANISTTKTACTASTAYKEALAAKRTMSRCGVPNTGRWMIAAPEYLEVLMQDPLFVKQGDLSQELVKQGVVGRIAGFNVFESNNMLYKDKTFASGKETTTEFICGHPNWCHRVMEWQIPVHKQDLAGSGKYIGASPVQGRKVFGTKVSKGQTLYIKRIETAVSGG